MERKMVGMTKEQIVLTLLGGANCKNPVTQEMFEENCISDSDARKIISELRSAGMPVVANLKHRGYWLASDEEELKTFLRRYRANAIERLARARKMEDGFYESMNEVLE